MARAYSELTKRILLAIEQSPGLDSNDIYTQFESIATNKKIYNALFRLTRAEIITENEHNAYNLTGYGTQISWQYKKEVDGIWRIVIFDIPETQRKVRNFLRQKLKQLGFKLWQNSIWISPYALAPGVEKELLALANQYFVRLIKTTDINYTKDLQRQFPELKEFNHDDS